ncbi:MAG TPA: nitrophenyl compound nitroreductase subunit ArsF family protein [Polyangiaceae bacterium]|nr:nitrophenyl compound nitroreductase subunit ArsF family protein [Polyangiaceae bacterium]
MSSTSRAPRPAAAAPPRAASSPGGVAVTTHVLGRAALLMLAGALAVAGCKRSASETTGATAEAVAATSAAPAVDPANRAADGVVVYYFHGNRRCRTCMGIQRAIETTIQERFAAETASGVLVFREVNIDEPANAHFVAEFDLSSSSMVVAARSGDGTIRWENCAEVWPLARDEAALGAYAEQQIRRYLALVQRT